MKILRRFSLVAKPVTCLTTLAGDDASILNYKMYAPNSVAMFIEGSNGTEFAISSPSVPSSVMAAPFSYAQLLYWEVISADPFEALFYERAGRVYGLGFGVRHQNLFPVID